MGLQYDARFVAKCKRFLRVIYTASPVKEKSTQEVTASVPSDLEMPVSLILDSIFWVNSTSQKYP